MWELVNISPIFEKGFKGYSLSQHYGSHHNKDPTFLKIIGIDRFTLEVLSWFMSVEWNVNCFIKNSFIKNSWFVVYVWVLLLIFMFLYLYIFLQVTQTIVCLIDTDFPLYGMYMYLKQKTGSAHNHAPRPKKGQMT